MPQPAERRLPAILVVDDEPRSLEAIRRTLEEDFEVYCANGAAQALELLEQEQASAGICIVLTDQRMPDTTGVQFLKTVRERWPDLVRIILSGYTDSDDIISGVNDAGIWQYLLKPWQPEQLLLTLQRAAEVWRLQQDNLRLALDLRMAGPVLKRQLERRRTQAHQRRGLRQRQHAQRHVVIGGEDGGRRVRQRQQCLARRDGRHYRRATGRPIRVAGHELAQPRQRVQGDAAALAQAAEGVVEARHGDPVAVGADPHRGALEPAVDATADLAVLEPGTVASPVVLEDVRDARAT